MKLSFVLVFHFVFAGTAISQVGQVYIDASRPLNRIPSTIYGSCIEDVNHEIYGGFYDQRIFGESFEAPATGIDHGKWKSYAGFWSATTGYAEAGISIAPGRGTSRMVSTNTLGVEPDQGAKLIYQPGITADGEFIAETRFEELRGTSAGLLFRVSEPGMGDQLLHGYEAALNRENHQLELSKFRDKKTLLKSVPVQFDPSDWNKLRIVFMGTRIEIYLNDSARASLAFTDNESPITTGKIGFRTWRAPLQFRNPILVVGGKSSELPLLQSPSLSLSKDWDAVATTAGNIQFAVDQSIAKNGRSSQMIDLGETNSQAGIANMGLNRWGIALGSGKKYTGSYYIRSSEAVSAEIRLESRDGTKIYARSASLPANGEWKLQRFDLVSDATDTAARFVFMLNGKGKVWIDQVSLFCPDDQYKGIPVRKDIGEMIRAEGLSFLRYAGSMVNSPEYRFKKMIGPRENRPPYTGHWNKYSTNGFGFEEFLQYCEAAGFEASFAVNIEETPEDMADMIEYLKGDSNTTWGRKRVDNGHAQPYKFKYIEIGNEEVLFEGDNEKIYRHYIERFNLLYDAMRTKDTSLVFIHSAWWRPESKHMPMVFKALDGKAAYWDFHPWADDQRSGTNVDSSLREMKKLFRSWNPNTTMKVAIFEENGALHNMRRALGHATVLNAVRRHGDFLLTSCPANMLQPFRENENSWDQGQIFFTASRVWAMPPFYAQQMASANHQPIRILDSIAGTNLDVTATTDEKKTAIVVHIVNPDSSDALFQLHLAGFKPGKKPAQLLTLSGGYEEDNIPADPKKISTKKHEVKTADIMSKSQTIPARTYMIIRIEK